MGKRRPSGDGLVRKRADGRWEGRIVVGHKEDGKPIYRSVFAEKQGDLMPKLHELKDQYAGVELTEDSSISLGEWLGRWLEDYKKPTLRPSTYAGYSKDITNHILPYLGSKRITQLKTAEIQKHYNRLLESGRIQDNCKGKGLSNATVRGIHMILREALDSAVREGLIPKNPADGTSPPKIYRNEKQVLTKDQIETFMKLIEGDEEWYDFFYTEIITGMRQGEICGLRWEDFDREKRTLRVARSVDFVNKELVVGETKTDDGKRTIYLPDSLWHILAERQRQKGTFSEWIFPNLLKPEWPLNPSRAYRQLKKLLEIGGLPSIRFHDLRHTFTSHAANSGIAPKTLSEIVGHSKASFTLDHYAHVTSDMQKNAANIVTNYITDILGKELKPWQNAEKQAKEH
ncbi:MAG: site-specific integrase [Clostridia bacterium]|nr:site-specific integrase [Clostridia bacterium]